jgi:TolB-like protein
MTGRKAILFVLWLVLSGLAFGQPSLAFIDALLDEGLDPAIRVPITEKIIEQMVTSGLYRVLDRSSILQVLEEKEFQFSGLVADSEIKQAGQYLGADFVGVARVSRVGQTYFISAKLIDVETGEIAAQASHEMKGEADVVFDLSRIVARVLIGLDVEEEELEKAPETAVFDRPVEPLQAGRPWAHLVASYLYSEYGGDGYDHIEWLHESHFPFSDWWVEPLGVDLHVLQPLFGPLYASMGVAYTIATYYNDDWGLENSDFNTLDFRVNVGGIATLIPQMQVFGGVGAGYFSMTFGDYWVGEGDVESGLAISVEAGVEFRFIDLLVLVARVQYTSVPTLTADEFFVFERSFDYIGYIVGVGIAY